jgi:hypothetical protein
LLYVKTPAPDRDPRLAGLLDRIKQQGSDSYRYFRTPRELGRLVRGDLAALLSEQFAATRPPGPAPSATPRGHHPRPLPVGTTSLVGREQAIDEVAELLGRPEVRLVTLTGPGGVGKTRLALAVGEQVRDRFAAGAVFVPLAGVTRPELVVAGIARAVGAELAGTDSPLQALAERLGDDRWLLVLDNLEQVLEVAGDLEELLARCPHPAARPRRAPGPAIRVAGRAGGRRGGPARTAADPSRHGGVERGPAGGRRAVAAGDRGGVRGRLDRPGRRRGRRPG